MSWIYVTSEQLEKDTKKKNKFDILLTKSGYEKCLARLEILMDSDSTDEIAVLAYFLEEYEEKHFPM